jgi:hypothetical protein
MSVFFQQNGLKEHLIISPTNSNLELTGNFTIEFFLKTNPLYASQYPIILTGNYNYTTSTNLAIYTNRHESPNSIIIFQGSSWFVGTINVNNNAWHHVAVVRNGTGSNNIKLYIDGQSDGVFTTNNTINYNINGLYISKNEPSIETDVNKFQGSLSNLRIVNGTAVYTSNFTPPTTSLSNISGTALLLFNNPSDLFVDGSPNNYTVTKFTSPNFPTASADSPVTYSPSGSPAPCFKENSKILCLVDGMEKELLVQDIRKGILVKTLLNGYLPVDMIGTSKLFNPANSERYADRLYLCSQEMYPELNEDLIITGNHSILVDKFKGDEKEKILTKFKKIYITDKKYRLAAEFDERAVPYEVEGEFNIYHIALENESYYSNFGIYANKLLVESCSKRYLKELSNMTLL